MPMLFNVRRKDQYVTVSSAPELNPTNTCTFEAVCTLVEDSDAPTILSRPYRTSWEPPFVVYRIGFCGKTRKPEFQLLFENEPELTTIVGERAIELDTSTHLAGTYDGTWMRLYVNGILVASEEKEGKLQTTVQPTVFATRSSTDVGGMLVGTLQEIRIWNVARSGDDINLWKNRLLPVEPQPDGLVCLWEGEPGPPEEITDLLQKGFANEEARLIHFVQWYAGQYNAHSQSLLQENVRRYYGEGIRSVRFYRACDGYITLYSPDYSGLMKAVENEPERGELEFLVCDRQEESVSKLMQDWTANKLKILIPPIERSVADKWTLPPDVDDPSAATVTPAVLESSVKLPVLSISPKVSVENGLVKAIVPERIRVISPIIETSPDEIVRQFTWSFADIWLGGLTRELLHLPNTVHFLYADAQVLQWCVDLSLPPERLVDDGPNQAIEALRSLIKEFEALLDKEGVDEVQDIQPFLSERRHWVLLSPSCKDVWPQKMLGNKWKVDFVVRESDDTYAAIEIESPNFQLYTKGLNPHHKLTHAEQQVRDYCEYVDQNRDSVEREEGLSGIYRPKGVVVIGRRSSLDGDAMRKLVARNADAGRYTVMVYDDLIDRVRALVDSVAALIGAH